MLGLGVRTVELQSQWLVAVGRNHIRTVGALLLRTKKRLRKLWPEVVFPMRYIKNNQLTRALQNISPYRAQKPELSRLAYLRILGSTVYVFLHKEEWALKSGKPAPRALKSTLVGYDGHTIYRVHIKDQNKVIHMEGLQLFEGFKAKISIGLLDYNDGTPTFQACWWSRKEWPTYILRRLEG